MLRVAVEATPANLVQVTNSLWWTRGLVKCEGGLTLGSLEPDSGPTKIMGRTRVPRHCVLLQSTMHIEGRLDVVVLC